MYDFQDGRLLGDAKTLSGKTALEHSENESGKVEAIPKFTVAGGGFPCKDVSLQLQEVGRRLSSSLEEKATARLLNPSDFEGQFQAISNQLWS